MNTWLTLAARSGLPPPALIDTFFPYVPYVPYVPSQAGGGVAVTGAGSRLELTASTISECTSQNGGGVFATGTADSAATLRITDTSLTRNRGGGKAAHGAGLSAYFASVSLSNASVSGNLVRDEDPGSGPFDRVAEITPYGAGAGGGLFLVLSTAVQWTARHGRESLPSSSLRVLLLAACWSHPGRACIPPRSSNARHTAAETSPLLLVSARARSTTTRQTLGLACSSQGTPRPSPSPRRGSLGTAQWTCSRATAARYSRRGSGSFPRTWALPSPTTAGGAFRRGAVRGWVVRGDRSVQRHGPRQPVRASRLRCAMRPHRTTNQDLRRTISIPAAAAADRSSRVLIFLSGPSEAMGASCTQTTRANPFPSPAAPSSQTPPARAPSPSSTVGRAAGASPRRPRARGARLRTTQPLSGRGPGRWSPRRTSSRWASPSRARAFQAEASLERR